MFIPYALGMHSLCIAYVHSLCIAFAIRDHWLCIAYATLIPAVARASQRRRICQEKCRDLK